MYPVHAYAPFLNPQHCMLFHVVDALILESTELLVYESCTGENEEISVSINDVVCDFPDDESIVCVRG
jgi:hypothetical protein